MLDGGSSVGYWRHGKSPDIFCRIRERGCMCCSRWRCGTRRRCEVQRRRSSACCAYRCERVAARRGRPREDRAARGLFCGAFLHGKPLGPGRGDCAVGGGGVRRGRPRRTSAARRSLRLSHCRLPARLQRCSLWMACGNRGRPPAASAGMGESFAHGAFHARRAFRGAAPPVLPFGSLGPARTRLRDVAFHRSAVHAAAFRGAESRESRPGLAGELPSRTQGSCDACGPTGGSWCRCS